MSPSDIASSPRLIAAGIREAAVLVTLDVTNNFPQLPVRSDGPYLVWLGIAPDDKAKIKRGKIAVDKGQEIDIAVTPGAAGSYSLTCTHFMHDMMGMHGTITVQ